MIQVALLLTLLPGPPVPQAEAGPAPVYVTMVTHFDEPWNMSSADIDAFRQLGLDHPGVKWTHLFNPAAYTQSTPLLAAMETLVKEHRDLGGGEIGVHTHMYASLVQAAGVAFHTSPSVNGSPPGCGSDGSGYAVPTSSYTYDEIRKILAFSVDTFVAHGLCRPRTYCAGYYTTDLDLQRALVDTDFHTSASAFPAGTVFGAAYGGCWSVLSGWTPAVTHTTAPYPVSALSIQPGAGPPYLAGDLGTLLEIPQVCKIDWMVSATDMKQIFADHLALAQAGTPTAVCLAMHDILAASERAKFHDVLTYIDSFVGGSTPVIYATAAEVRAAFLGLDDADSFGLFLSGDTDAISVSAGGAQRLDVDTCAPTAGVGYAILGSASGTSPGIGLGGGLTLPLNFDAYLNLTVNTLLPAAKPPVIDAFANLDLTGAAQPRVELPPGLDPTLVGLVLNHACVTFTPFTFAPLAASNPVAVQLVP